MRSEISRCEGHIQSDAVYLRIELEYLRASLVSFTVINHAGDLATESSGRIASRASARILTALRIKCVSMNQLGTQAFTCELIRPFQLNDSELKKFPTAESIYCEWILDARLHSQLRIGHVSLTARV